MFSLNNLRNTLGLRLEQCIKRDKNTFLYHLPLELRNELYKYQYSVPKYTYKLKYFKVNRTVFIKIFNNERNTLIEADVIFLALVNINCDIVELLENFYRTGQFHLQIDDVCSIDMTETTLVINNFQYPRIDRNHCFPLSLTWINILHELEKYRLQTL